MGAKFANLNIRTADEAAVSALCPELKTRAVVPGWVTAAGENLEWGTAQKEARRLSKVLPCPVVSTEYFDDDFVEFAVYQSGKRTARHIPAAYEGYGPLKGKPKAWANALDLPQEGETALKAIFRETGPELSLRLLECVLGCPLWVDAEFLEEVAPPDPAYLEAYLDRKKAESKLKNQTKLVLLDEVAGDFGWHLTYPAVRREEQRDRKTFWAVKDGRFYQLFEQTVPGKAVGYRAQDRGDGVSLLTFEDHGSREPADWGEDTVVFSDRGEVLEIFRPGETALENGCFLDRDRVFLAGACWNIRTHQKEWDLNLGAAAYGIHTPCRLDGGRLAVVYDLQGAPLDSYLVTFFPDGSGKCVKKLPHFRHWESPAADGDDLYLACRDRLTCYTPELEEQWSVQLEEDVGQLGKPYPDSVGRMLYMSTYRQVTAFNLETRRVSAVRKFAVGEDCFLQEVLPGVGPILLTGDASFEVWDRELWTISRHRAKGNISQWLRQEGCLYLLTTRDEERDVLNVDGQWQSVVKKPGCLRLYELK